MDDDAPRNSGPEPSLAARVARTTAETHRPEWPLTADDPDATTPEQETGLGIVEGRPHEEGGGRVDAAGATYGRADRVGVAADDEAPAESVGGGDDEATQDTGLDPEQATGDELTER